MAERNLPRWYAMLALDEPLPEAYVAFGTAIAVATGGTLFPHPHVTVAYLEGVADVGEVARSLQRLWGPGMNLRAEGLFSFWDHPHPLFGYTLSVRVAPDDDLYRWHVSIVDAARQVGLVPLFSWEEQHLHLRVVEHMAVAPAEALRLVGPDSHGLTVAATQLWVTRLRRKRFRTCLRMQLAAAAAPAHGCGDPSPAADSTGRSY